MNTILQGVHNVLAWFSDHPAVGAMVYGWACGILLTQWVKRFLPLAWVATPDKVKRSAVASAVISAGVFAYWAWPGAEPLREPAAVLCGLSCPAIYTWLKWLLPNMLRRWSWNQMAWKRASK